MAGTVQPRHRALLPDLMELLESGFPTMPMHWGTRGAHPIPIELSEDAEQYLLRAELPGVDPEKDIEITVQDDLLTVRAEHSEGKEDKHHSEFRYGSFERTIRLPAPVPEAGVRADYRDGILTVHVPRAVETRQAPRSIPVEHAE